MSRALDEISARVVKCKRCPRLRDYCTEVALVKKREFKDQTYYGLPVPGFGDPKAKLLLIGLAPAAHGANRTGRMFTGDNSGLWLYRALFRAGFSNREKSLSATDDLRLKGAYITATARCAPPENKPSKTEIENCREYLVNELKVLTEVKVYLALGAIGMRSIWDILPTEVKPQKGLPKFAHGAEVKLSDGRVLLCSYHPSQQNTFTKKLTEPMFDRIFTRANELITSADKAAER